ncbi:hypothetical protein LP43_1434 [Methylophaga thiooxydans]|uniref:RNA polymerase sigma-70 region 4 domain-containing protein n=1 Tax=Methylophaga thiooxydans TaxID=392484 RepID=A0A0A0BIJ2_9GAMM|nr:sigma factor-like helix-turn-helix DNA-binding protein [Methylophaga thiooxydans]KGM06939.1 hypothetical protein LP43_1434 [Methylophaga thiooxydans]
MSIDERVSHALSHLELRKSIKFLQIPCSELDRFGISESETLEQLLQEGNNFSASTIISNIYKSLKNCIIQSGEIDWLKYYSDNVAEFFYLYFECSEFNEIAEEFASNPINRHYFLSSSVTLLRENISNLKQLRDYLASSDSKEIRGFGKKKLSQLFDGIFRLIEDYNKGRLSSHISNERAERTIREGYQWSSPLFHRLNSKAINLPLPTFNLGQKSKHLSKYGVNNIGELIREFETGLRKYTLVGPKAMGYWLENLDALSRSINEYGDVDWRTYCDYLNIKCFPQSVEITSGQQFLEAMPLAFHQLSEAFSEPLENSILFNRIAAPYEQRKTLEELGQKFGITRERVRQKESRLIDIIIDALIYDRYQFIDYRFDTVFAQYFKEAASAFEQSIEINFDDFLSKLSTVWKVDSTKIIPHLPIITTILTGESITPKELRVSSSLPIGLYNEDLPATFDVPSLKNIRLGKLTDTLEELGVNSVTHLIEAYKNNDLPISTAKKSKVYEVLDKLAETVLSQDGRDFWQIFAENNNLRRIPEQQTEGPQDFFKLVIPTLSKIIQTDFQYKYALDVFLMRTSKPLRLRPTIDNTGLLLGTYGSVVKRLETKLVEFLHLILVEEDYRYSSVFVMPDFAKYWRIIYEEYMSSEKSFEDFNNTLHRKWQGHETALEVKIDLLWTICNIYPNARNRRVTKILKTSSQPPESPSLIKLRGFKKVF